MFVTCMRKLRNVYKMLAYKLGAKIPLRIPRLWQGIILKCILKKWPMRMCTGLM
jgi:hypothetical protein